LSTYVSHGAKSKLVEKTVLEYKNGFENLTISKPLLYDKGDYLKVCEILSNVYFDLSVKGQLVLVAHGSKKNNSHLEKLSTISREEEKCVHFEIGSLEGYPGFEDIYNNISKGKISNVILMPFMVASSYHSNKDIFGDFNSWKTRFLDSGVSVFESKTQLLELDSIQRIFIEHLCKIINKSI